MKEQTPDEPSRYRIGAVARLTGISPDTLRVWERRYAAVCPQRSPRGGRLYGPEDVARLRLMKQLVDAGDAIGEIAGLDTQALQARAADSQRLPAGFGASGSEKPCRLLVVGESLSRMVQSTEDVQGGIEPVALFSDLADFEAHGGGVVADVIVVEQATLHDDTAARVVDWLSRTQALHALLVYRYASADALLRLPASKCSALRAPLDLGTLRAHCLSATGASPAVAAEDLAITHPAPRRRYDDQTLAQIAALSSTVRCECPRHLAELITGLSAFERYSTECESRNSRDAALHAFLHATASRARHIIEEALDRVIEMEDIKL